MIAVTQRQGLLAAVLDEPWDDDLRGIFADYLEELGDPVAPFWRLPAPERVDALDAWQLQLLPVICDHWLSIGLATGLADRDASWAACQAAYQVAGLEPPRLQIWLASPLAGAIAAVTLSNQVENQVGDPVGDPVWNQVWNQVLNQVRTQVLNQVGNQVWDQIENQVLNQVWNQVGNQVWNQVRNQVWNQVGNQVGNQVRNQVRNQVGNQVGKSVWKCAYGQHDSDWLSFYATILVLCRLDCCRRLAPLLRLAQQCGWWWPFEGAVVFTERPVEIDVKNQKLVSIRYADGFEVKGR